MPQFDVTTFTSQIFWLLVVFGGFLFVCYKFYFPKLTSMLKDRASRLNDEQGRLDHMRREIEVLENQKAEKIRAVHRQIADMIQNAEHEANAKLNKQLASLDGEITENIKELEDSLNRQRTHICESIEDTVSACVQDVIQKITAPYDAPSPLKKRKNKQHVH